MTDALLDLDVCAFRCAASTEKRDKEGNLLALDPQEIAIERADKWVRDTLFRLDNPNYRGFLTGKGNFRYTLYPDYKANRSGKPKPEHLQATRDFLVSEWKAEVTEGYEADDALAMYDGVKVSNDKDLLQLPGQHYNPVTGEFLEVGEFEGLYHLYTQLLVGDRSDNVPGFDGTARGTVPKFIQRMLESMSDYEQEIYDVYEDKYQFLINYNLLRMWSKPDDYVIPECLLEELTGAGLYKQGQEVTCELLLSTRSLLSPSLEPTA